MTKPAAIRACFSDWKLIRTRSVVQLVFELPLEAADQAYTVLGGMPNPAAEIWCGIARLRDDKKSGAGAAASPREAVDSADIGGDAAASRSKRSWHDMSASQQAGVLCNDVGFQRFLYEMHACPVMTADEAAESVRIHCGVTSRKDIGNVDGSDRLWRDLVSDYRIWEKALV